MEDEKLAAYYDDLTRRGGGAARFKQGLGFSSNTSSTNDDVPTRGSALPAATSFLSSFVKASSPSKTSELEKEAQLQSIQSKLSKKPKARSRSPSRNPIRRSRSRSPSRDRIGDRQSKPRSRSRSRSRDRTRDRHSKRRRVSRSRSRDRHSRRRSRSRSRDRRSRRRSRTREDGSERRHRSRSRSRENNRERSKRHGSPEERRSDKGKKHEVARGGGGGIDFAKLIDGYDSMAPAERVKAKMKLQLSETAENDETIGKGSGWERFEFDKDAPLDDEEDIEAVEDDAALVKKMGQSFRFSAVAARKEEEMKALHDEAIFGVSSHHADRNDEADAPNSEKENVETAPATSLLSNQVLTMNRGSWRDRASKR